MQRCSCRIHQGRTPLSTSMSGFPSRKCSLTCQVPCGTDSTLKQSSFLLSIISTRKLTQEIWSLSLGLGLAGLSCLEATRRERYRYQVYPSLLRLKLLSSASRWFKCPKLSRTILSSLAHTAQFQQIGTWKFILKFWTNITQENSLINPRLSVGLTTTNKTSNSLCKGFKACASSLKQEG